SIIGIVFLFSFSVVVVLIAPSYVDKTWTQPTSAYQVQIYEIADPNVFISGSMRPSQQVQTVNRLQEGFSLLAFQESESLKIKAPAELEKYVTRAKDPTLKLTSRLLLLKPTHSLEAKASYQTFELYDPKKSEVFIRGAPDTVLENWVDENYEILDPKEAWHTA